MFKIILDGKLWATVDTELELETYLSMIATFAPLAKVLIEKP